MDIDAAAALLAERDEPAYRVTQARRAALTEYAESWDEVSTLPRALRVALDERAPLRELVVEAEQVAADGTIKLRLRTADGYPVEAVAMRHRDRRTVCLSSQSGCALACTFCATGAMGLGRNLTPGEIVEQLVVLARRLRDSDGARVHNVVMMGMGEPFQNYDRVLDGLPDDERSDRLRARRAPDRDLDGRLGPGHRPARRRADADQARALAARTGRRAARAADAGHAALPDRRADGCVPALPRRDPSPGLRRVPAARGRERLARHTRGRSPTCCARTAAAPST